MQEELLAKVDRPAKMEWKKTETPTDVVEARVEGTGGRQDRRGDQPEGQAHARAGRRSGEATR